MTTGSYSEERVELTPRMRDVLVSAADGRTVTQTARELGISEGTVKSVRAAALARLHAASMAHAIALALRRGEL